MLYVIEAILTDDEGELALIYEEYTDRREADIRYDQLVTNFDEPVYWKEIKL